MLNASDVNQLRTQGMTNMDILKTIGTVEPSARQRYDQIVNDKTIPEWQKDDYVKQLIDKKVPKTGPSGMSYVNTAMMNDVQKKYDEKTAAMNKPAEQGFFGRAIESVKSIPERVQRSFGSAETREGRQETSRGFDLADLPGDIADIVGPSLPVIGGILGGSAAGILTAPTGPGAVAGAAAGAAAGAGAMEGGRRMIGDLMGVDERFSGKETDFSPTGDVMQGVGKETALGAIGEAGGQLLVKGITKVAAPFAKQFMSDIAEMSARKGIKMPVSAMTKSPIVHNAEAISTKGIFGRQVQEVSEKAASDMAKMGDEIVKGLNGSDDLVVAGKSIEQGANAFRTTWQGAKKTLYSKAAELIDARPKREYIDVSKPVQILQNILKSKGRAQEVLGNGVNVGRLETILKNLSDKKLSIGILESTSNELGSIIKDGGLVKTGDEAALASVQGAIQEALETHIKTFAPEISEALAKADDAYKKGIEILDSQIGNKISSLSDTPERILESVIRPNSESNVNTLLKMIGTGEGGPRRIANVKTAFARKLMSESMNNDGFFAGDRLMTNLRKYNPKTLNALFGPDTVKQLDELSKLVHAFNAGSKVQLGSQTAFIQRAAAAATALLAGRPDLTIAIVASDYGLTKLFTTDAGRKLLMEGYQMQLQRGIPNAVQGGVQAVDQLLQDEPTPPAQ